MFRLNLFDNFDTAPIGQGRLLSMLVWTFLNFALESIIVKRFSTNTVEL